MKTYYKKQIKHEKGQIIVLLAVSLVVVMMVAALAVDGGMIYSERRFIQNGADAASLAGGGEILHYMEASDNDGNINMTKATFQCTDEIINAAKDKAILSAYVNNIDLPYLGKKVYKSENNTWTWVETAYDGNDLDANHGVVILCNEQEKYYDTQVKITSSISTAFAHLIFPDNLTTTNEAVSRSRPMAPYADGYALVSLSKNCKNFADGGMYISGSSILNIEGSGTHSNSCLEISGTGNNLVINTDTGLNLAYSDATINGVNTFDYNGNADLIEAEEIELPEPVCDDSSFQPAIQITGGTHTISAGNYYGIKITGGDVTFQGQSVDGSSEGLFCLKGDLEMNGGFVLGNGVTFRMMLDDSSNNPKVSDVTITAKTTAILAAPYLEEPNKSDNFGLLFYMDENNPGTMKLVGNNLSYFSGITYAPTGYITVGGTTDVNKPEVIPYTEEQICNILQSIDPENKCESIKFSAQFIGYSVLVSGDGNLDILYDPTGFDNNPGQLYLER